MNVVMYSGGAGSWATAKRVAERHGTDNLVLLVANTNTEAADWATFVHETSLNVGGTLVMLNNGEDIWDVFMRKRFIGNTRADVCSRILKREPLLEWLEDNCDPAKTTVYLGFDWTEEHRMERARTYWEPWHVEAPLCDEPYLDKGDVLEWLVDEGLPVPSLYKHGFSHNNCGGGCVKAGQAQWRLLLKADRTRYLWNEAKENKFRAEIGKDVAILRDRRGGTTKPLTLEKFRHSLEVNPESYDHEDWGSCSCMELPLET